ncbi:MAG: 1-deoxy-D-xylulose-5-phosphate reductoisomerase [Hyphomicrobiaceae bacterium]|nr:1-deoxy-D-xylulose-5-phosphate reductoisomerase [Hyphomicrobiaceae bacterium]
MRQSREESATTKVRRISVLGATGSIGSSTLDLIGRASDAFSVAALTAQSNVTELATCAVRHRAALAVIGDAQRYQQLKAALSGTGIRVAAGRSGLEEAATMPADCIVAAIAGAAGLAPSLTAVRQGTRVALANKECLVAAGALFMREVARSGAELLPVDSEHSAAFQALAGEAERDGAAIERITLTASGGPFRDWTAEQLASATPEQALRHPNWSMGAKITVDSATLMNKGLELIEAFHLFPVGAEQLDAVVHPQSIVHCLVAYRDGSVLAQLANPDMRTPIAYALSWPKRMYAPTSRLDLVKIGSLTFEAPDPVRFPALRLAMDALAEGGAAPTILNAANEMAVQAFLERRIGFMGIPEVVQNVLERAAQQGMMRPIATLEDVYGADREARELARDVISSSQSASPAA